MIRGNIPASVAASPINHERPRGDGARDKIDASPRRREPKPSSRSDRATVLIFGQSVHIEAEIRAVLSTSRRPAFKTGDLLACHASFSRSESAVIIDLGWHQRALAHAARLASQSSTLTVFSLVIASTPSAIANATMPSMRPVAFDLSSFRFQIGRAHV